MYVLSVARAVVGTGTEDALGNHTFEAGLLHRIVSLAFLAEVWGGMCVCLPQSSVLVLTGFFFFFFLKDLFSYK